MRGVAGRSSANAGVSSSGAAAANPACMRKMRRFMVAPVAFASSIPPHPRRVRGAQLDMDGALPIGAPDVAPDRLVPLHNGGIRVVEAVAIAHREDRDLRRDRGN